VDEDLEDEIAEECQKYGDVVRVMIFEVTDPNYRPEEAVRIFVEFTQNDGAIKVWMCRLIFREHPVNIETFREHPGNVRTFREL
jgi:hypothetical protein